MFPWGNTWHWWTNCAEYQWKGCLQTHEEWSSRWLEYKNGLMGSNPPAEVQRFIASFTYPVGTFPQDRSLYGCLDMGGNVSELCELSDAGASRNRWVFKGGNFNSPWWECRVSARRTGLELPSLSVGFRCVYTGSTGPRIGKPSSGGGG
jgi:formylglycine-generating enzyme required for sulfatase activity